MIYDVPILHFFPFLNSTHQENIPATKTIIKTFYGNESMGFKFTVDSPLVYFPLPFEALLKFNRPIQSNSSKDDQSLR